MNAMPSIDWGADAFNDAMFAAGFEPQCMGLAMYELFVRHSTMREDTREATDFVSAGGKYRWGSRIRRVSSTKEHRDITFRTSRPSRQKTEVDKLANLDLYLYAWVGSDLEEFVVFAVKPLIRSGAIDRAPRRSNYDNSSEWCYLPVTVLQEIPDCLLAGRRYPGRPISFRYTTSRECLDHKGATA